MLKKELILLDAEVINVISKHTFYGKLKNGHEFVAYIGNKEATSNFSIKKGDFIKVEISPFDMSKGRIILTDNITDNES